MKEPEHFGELLKEMRIAYGINQEKMSELLAMSSKNYGRIERGEVKLTAEKFHKYSVLFNRQLLEQTAFVLDERFTPSGILGSAARMLERLFMEGSR
tara:strand:+ start:226 stop:516 length:291 start_codon:yes stop_codon:yes gene_type:complete